MNIIKNLLIFSVFFISSFLLMSFEENPNIRIFVSIAISIILSFLVIYLMSDNDKYNNNIEKIDENGKNDIKKVLNNIKLDNNQYEINTDEPINDEDNKPELIIDNEKIAVEKTINTNKVGDEEPVNIQYKQEQEKDLKTKLLEISEKDNETLEEKYHELDTLIKKYLKNKNIKANYNLPSNIILEKIIKLGDNAQKIENKRVNQKIIQSPFVLLPNEVIHDVDRNDTYTECDLPKNVYNNEMYKINL